MQCVTYHAEASFCNNQNPITLSLQAHIHKHALFPNMFTQEPTHQYKSTGSVPEKLELCSTLRLNIRGLKHGSVHQSTVSVLGTCPH